MPNIAWHARSLVGSVEVAAFCLATGTAVSARVGHRERSVVGL